MPTDTSSPLVQADVGVDDPGMTLDIDPCGCGDRYLFHYTSPAGLAGILHAGRFRFSSMDRLNDPRERKPFEFGLNEALIPTEDVPRAREMLGRTISEIFGTAKVACFTTEGTDGSPDGYFSRGWSRARAWAQYGMDHKGACLVFDKERLTAAIKDACGPEMTCGPVAYEDRQNLDWSDGPAHFDNLTDDEMRQHALELRNAHGDQLFFEKNTDWASEREYRFVTFAPDAFEVSIVDSLEGIILGEDYPPVEQAVLGERIRQADIKRIQIGEMIWMNGCPGTARVNADHLPGLEDDLDQGEPVPLRPVKS